MTRNELKQHCEDVTERMAEATDPRSQRLFEEHSIVLGLLQSEKDLQMQNREAAQTLIEEIGAPGPESINETATRAVNVIKELNLLVNAQYEIIRATNAKGADEARAELRNWLADERIISLYENGINDAIERSGKDLQDGVWILIYQALDRAARIVHGEDGLEDGKTCPECSRCDGGHKMDCSKGSKSLTIKLHRYDREEADVVTPEATESKNVYAKGLYYHQEIRDLRRRYDEVREHNCALVLSGHCEVDREKLFALLQETLAGLVIPYKEGNSRSFEELFPQFEAWWAGTDEKWSHDIDDLAFGWFVGRGFSDEEAAKAADHMLDEHGG